MRERSILRFFLAFDLLYPNHLKMYFFNYSKWFIFLCSIFIIIILILSTGLSASEHNSFPKPYLSFHFDAYHFTSYSKSIEYNNHGGHIISDGVVGSALRLSTGAYLELDLSKFLSSKHGTLMFWVKPHWGYYDHDGNELLSHTFFSMTWNDQPPGSFILSDGWWEPAGSLNTYFIANNQLASFLTTKLLYVPGEWYHIASTWRSGSPGRIELFVDGKLVSTQKKYPSASFSPKTNFFIGSDKGAPSSKNRYADADFDELLFFDKALSGAQISAWYKKQANAKPVRKSRHLYDTLKKPYHPKRNDRGTILESRVILDEGTGWMTASGAQETINNIKNAGFNVYIPCIWHGKGTRYSSKVAPKEAFLAFNTDPLKRLIDIAHANNVEVHPWFTVALRQRD